MVVGSICVTFYHLFLEDKWWEKSEGSTGEKMTDGRILKTMVEGSTG